MVMTLNDLLLRCYAKKEPEGWVAVCIDLTLAAQGESFEEARAKLDEMIVEYVYDAVAGEDVAYAKELLTRRASWRDFARFYSYRLLNWVGAMRQTVRRSFFEPIPLVPAPHNL